MKRREAAMWNSLQLVVLAICFYTSEKLKYDVWTVVRIIIYCAKLNFFTILMVYFI